MGYDYFAGVIAPLTIDGAINRDLFSAYVEQVLVPTLEPDDVVIVENLRVHRMDGVHQAIEAAGAKVLFLCGPDLNPIELALSKLKALRPNISFGVFVFSIAPTIKVQSLRRTRRGSGLSSLVRLCGLCEARTCDVCQRGALISVCTQRPLSPFGIRRCELSSGVRAPTCDSRHRPPP